MLCSLRFDYGTGLNRTAKQRRQRGRVQLSFNGNRVIGLEWRARLCSFCVMPATAILRTRIDPRRKARVEKILDQLGMTSTQAVNMFFAQIERRKAIPFPVAV